MRRYAGGKKPVTINDLKCVEVEYLPMRMQYGGQFVFTFQDALHNHAEATHPASLVPRPMELSEPSCRTCAFKFIALCHAPLTKWSA